MCMGDTEPSPLGEEGEEEDPQGTQPLSLLRVAAAEVTRAAGAGAVFTCRDTQPPTWARVRGEKRGEERGGGRRETDKRLYGIRTGI